MTTPAYSDITGLVGIAVAFAATLLAIPGVRRISGPRLAGLLATGAALALIPFDGLSVAACVRGAFGDLSITTLFLLGSAVIRCLTCWPRQNHRTGFALRACISIAALALYPMALGVGMFDPYRLGYGSLWLLSAFFAVALAAWFGRCEMLATFLALATLAWTCRWYESTNLWDYLLDPLVSFYALGSLAICGMKRMANRFRGTASSEVTTPS